MKNVTNKFGCGELYDERDLCGKIYCIGCACLSVTSEYLSWANNPVNQRRHIADNINDADIIIILSCQVTDLAILNDLKHLKSLKKDYPDKDFYIGGCLAKRFDIEFDAKRLDNIKCDGQQINDDQFLDYKAPFWVPGFDHINDNILADGNLFRHSYPLRIGAGCRGNCTYCTIRETRGDVYEISYSDLKGEFLNDHFNYRCRFSSDKKDIVLISDNPTPDQIQEWCMASCENNKAISLRNVEPHTVVKSRGVLKFLSEKGLLKVLHVPIQSSLPDTLKDMGRSVKDTETFLNDIIPVLAPRTILATNVIIEYKKFRDPDMDKLKKCFDYISWNLYWSGTWIPERAILRWNRYFPWQKLKESVI